MIPGGVRRVGVDGGLSLGACALWGPKYLETRRLGGRVLGQGPRMPTGRMVLNAYKKQNKQYVYTYIYIKFIYLCIYIYVYTRVYMYICVGLGFRA